MNEQKIKQLIIGLAETYGETLSIPRMQIYADCLKEFSLEDVKTGIKRLLKDSKIFRFPLPGQIINAMYPTSTVDAAAQELLQRCVTAIRDFGYANAAESKHYVGEIAWGAIGGHHEWLRFCCAGDNDVGGIEIGTARAQLREAIKAKLFRQFPSGRIDDLPPPGTKPKFNFPHIDPEEILPQRLNEEETKKRRALLKEQIVRITKDKNV